MDQELPDRPLTTSIRDIIIERGDPQIVNIAPAGDGWRVVLTDPDNEKKWFTFPIVCWALIRRTYVDDGDKGVDTYVAPMVPEVKANEPSGVAIMDSENFVGVAAPNEDPEDVIKRHRHVQMVEGALEKGSAGSC